MYIYREGDKAAADADAVSVCVYGVGVCSVTGKATTLMQADHKTLMWLEYHARRLLKKVLLLSPLSSLLSHLSSLLSPLSSLLSPLSSLLSPLLEPCAAKLASPDAFMICQDRGIEIEVQVHLSR
jgi:hypothetical protein